MSYQPECLELPKPFSGVEWILVSYEAGIRHALVDRSYPTEAEAIEAARRVNKKPKP